MNADDTLNYMEKIIQGNPHRHAQGWKFEINKRATSVRKEITSLRKFAMLKPGRVQEITLARAQFLEDRLNDILSTYQNQEG